MVTNPLISHLAKNVKPCFNPHEIPRLMNCLGVWQQRKKLAHCARLCITFSSGRECRAGVRRGGWFLRKNVSSAAAGSGLEK